MFRYHEHIKALCQANDIQWHFGFVNSALRIVRRIRLSSPVILTQRQYATALHEIGHLLSKQESVSILDLLFLWSPSPNMIHNEKEAWRWAESNALIWTPKMEQHKRYCLGTYGISDI